ncbi:MAG: hypothetical protein ACRC7O_04500 [Fimbriiglobus sp.]
MTTSFLSDAVLPRLCRGEPLAFTLSFLPAVDFTGLTVAVLLDSPEGVRTTISEMVGTGSTTETGVIHSLDEQSVAVYVTADDTALLADGADYQVVVMIAGQEYAVYTLPVVTPNGGPVNG